MKRILSLLLIVCICFCAVGCNKVTDANSSSLSSTITNSNKNELESIKDKKLELYHQFIHSNGQIKMEKYDLSQFSGIKDFYSNSNLFISADGSLYKIGEFSDGTNFKKIDSNVKFVKFKGDSTIISEQNDVYWYNEDEFTVSIQDTNSDYDYINSTEFWCVSSNHGIGGFVKNNEVFLTDCIQGFCNGSCVFPENAIYKFDVDEKIEYMIYSIIKTSKGYYYLEETINESEFDDVPTTCEYNLKKIENIGDDVVFFKYNMGSISILDKNNQLFVYTDIGGWKYQ